MKRLLIALLKRLTKTALVLGCCKAIHKVFLAKNWVDFQKPKRAAIEPCHYGTLCDFQYMFDPPYCAF